MSQVGVASAEDRRSLVEVPHQEAKVGLHPRHVRAPEEDMLEMKGGTSVTSLEGDTVASKEQTNGALGDAVCSQSFPCICAVVLTTACVCVAQKRLSSGTSSSERSAVAEQAE